MAEERANNSGMPDDSGRLVKPIFGSRSDEDCSVYCIMVPSLR